MDILGPYWSCDIQLVDGGLDDIIFEPYFTQIDKIKWFQQTVEMNQQQLYGYCQSLSAHQAFCEYNCRYDPLDSLKHEMQVYLGLNNKSHVNITFPFFVLLFKKLAN